MSGLDRFVQDFAAAMHAADARGPSARGRGGRVYRPGIGPHAELRAVALTRAEMIAAHPGRYGSLRTQVAYPGSRQKCDLLWPTLPDAWALGVKMIRVRGDNGKPSARA